MANRLCLFKKVLSIKKLNKLLNKKFKPIDNAYFKKMLSIDDCQ